ncbi:MAG: PilZ domain-containing protein [Terriglobia bacterium]
MAIERRRSDRLTITLPLLVRGVDENGDRFECDAQTVNVSREGARIRVSRSLATGQQVSVRNKLTQREATFRIAGPLVPLTEKGGEFGFMGPISTDLQLAKPTGAGGDMAASLWGIRFPPLTAGQDSRPKALLACRQCGGAEVAPVTIMEVDVLDSSGILARDCSVCQVSTPWGYAPEDLAAAAGPRSAEEPAGAERRKHRRVVLQMPILIRDYFGGVEITTSENVSKGGASFASEKTYQIGEGVLIACPYHKSNQNIEVPGHVVSRREVAGTNRRIYGVRYKSKN